MHQRFLMAAAALAALASFGAQAEDKIYRCGDTYQQVPCEQGKAIDASDKRTAAQQRDARDAAKADERQAKDLVAERKQREKAVAPQRDPLRTGAPPAPAASTPQLKPVGHTKKPGKGKTKPEVTDPQYLAPKQPPTQ